MAGALIKARGALLLCGCALLLSSAARAEGAQAAPFAEQAQKARAAEERLELEVAKGLWLELSARQDLDEAELAVAYLNAGRMARLLGENDEARRHFRAALELQPEVELSEDDPPRMHESFDQVREEVQQSARRRAEKEAEERAAAASRPAPASSSSLPFELTPEILGGAAAAGAGVLVLGLGGLAGGLSAQANDQAEDEVIQLDRNALYDARDGWAIAANLSFLTGVVLLAGGGGLVAWTIIEEQE